MAKINKKQIISYENSETMPKFANSNELCPRKNGVHRGIYLPLEYALSIDPRIQNRHKKVYNKWSNL